MAYVIASACIDVKDGACQVACPVECIYEGGRMMYIHPTECINCGLCLSICPVDAIFDEADLPAHEAHFLRVNAEFFGPEVTGWGEPGGVTERYRTDVDHAVVAACEPRKNPAA